MRIPIRRKRICALRVQKKIEKGFPTKVSAPITGKYWAEGPAPLLSVIRFMFISINTVIIVMVPFAL